MALSGTNTIRLSSASSSNFSSEVRWRATQDRPNNRSTITVEYWLYAAYAISGSIVRTGTTTIAGQSGTGTYTVTTNGWAHKYTVSKTVNHNSEGKLSTSIQVSAPIMFTYAGTYVGTANHNFNITLDDIPRNTSITGLTAGTTTRNSVPISWKSSLAVNAYSFRIGSGSWSTVAASGTSGSFTVNGLSEGASSRIDVKLRSAYSNAWTATSSVTVTTKNTSSISSWSVAPVFGTNSAVAVTFATTQTGGTTTVQYQRTGNATWTNITNGGQITGLANDTSYTVTLRAVNSSGETNGGGSKTVSTYASPTAVLSLSDINKKSYSVQVTGSNFTQIQRYSGGAWGAITSPTTYTSTPGTSVTERVRTYSSTSGLYSSETTATLTMRSLAVANVTIDGGRRDRLTVSGTSTEVERVRIQFGTTPVIESALVSNAFSETKTGYFSDTTEAIKISFLDRIAQMWTPYGDYTGKTAEFRIPVVTNTVSDYDALTITIAPNQGQAFIYNGVLRSDPITVNVTTFTQPAPILTNQVYNYTVPVQDGHGKPGAVNFNVAGSGRTKAFPAHSSSLSNSGLFSPTTAKTISISQTEDLYYNVFFKASDKNSETTTNALFTAWHRDSAATSSATYELSSARISYLMENNPTTKNPTIFAVFRAKSKVTGAYTHERRVIELPTEISNSYLSTVTEPFPIIGGPSVKMVDSMISDLSIEVPFAKIVGLEEYVAPRSVTFNGITYTTSVIDNTAYGGKGKATFSLGKHAQISSGAYTTTFVDPRGLVLVRNSNVTIARYKPPAIAAAEPKRSDAEFGRDAIFPILTVSYFLETFNATPNSLVLFKVRYRVAGTSEWKVHPLNITPTQSSNGRIDISELLIAAGVDYFNTNSGYDLQIYAMDKFGQYINNVTGESAILKLSTGIPTMFMDELNRQVGVRTTTPRGAFEVEGDLYATKVISLGGIYFEPTDLT